MRHDRGAMKGSHFGQIYVAAFVAFPMVFLNRNENATDAS
jgi:hypothetical protein